MRRREAQSGQTQIALSLPTHTLDRLEQLRKAAGQESVEQVIQDAIEVFFRFRSPEQTATFQDLTPRLREVLRLIGDGKTSKEIAATLGISVKTVEMHRTHLMKTLDIRRVAGLVKFALQAGATSLSAKNTHTQGLSQ